MRAKVRTSPFEALVVSVRDATLAEMPPDIAGRLASVPVVVDTKSWDAWGRTDFGYIEPTVAICAIPHLRLPLRERREQVRRVLLHEWGHVLGLNHTELQTHGL